jgi:hypothetical protein
MTETKRAVHEIVHTRAMHLNAAVQGLVTGLIAGLGVFLATNWLILKGGEVIGPHLALLGQFFIGYRVSFVGSLVGFAYAFAFGYVLGYAVARIYNVIVHWKEASLDRRAPTA